MIANDTATISHSSQPKHDWLHKNFEAVLNMLYGIVTYTDTLQTTWRCIWFWLAILWMRQRHCILLVFSFLHHRRFEAYQKLLLPVRWRRYYVCVSAIRLHYIPYQGLSAQSPWHTCRSQTWVWLLAIISSHRCFFYWKIVPIWNEFQIGLNRVRSGQNIHLYTYRTYLSYLPAREWNFIASEMNISLWKHFPDLLK